MSNIRRECGQGKAIEQAIEKITEHLLSLPIGSELSMTNAAEAAYADEGYRWLNTEKGLVLSKDGGKTYLIKLLEMTGIQDLITRKLRGLRTLDFSKHDGSDEGWPFALDFVVREASRTPAIIVRNYGTYLPACTEIRIYDSDTDNLEVEEGILFSGKWPDFQGTYTVPFEKIREILSMCDDPILYEDIEEKMPEDVMILDGSVDELVICGKDRDTQLAYDNLWAYTSYFDTLPKARVAYVIINTVTELADDLTEPDRNR